MEHDFNILMIFGIKKKMTNFDSYTSYVSSNIQIKFVNKTEISHKTYANKALFPSTSQRKKMATSL